MVEVAAATAEAAMDAVGGGGGRQRHKLQRRLWLWQQPEPIAQRKLLRVSSGNHAVAATATAAAAVSVSVGSCVASAGPRSQPSPIVHAQGCSNAQPRASHAAYPEAAAEQQLLQRPQPDMSRRQSNSERCAERDASCAAL
jgi:hypothetical protein